MPCGRGAPYWSSLRADAILLIGAKPLDDFERDVLLLCAGVELDGAFASLCARENSGGRTARARQAAR